MMTCVRRSCHQPKIIEKDGSGHQCRRDWTTKGHEMAASSPGLRARIRVRIEDILRGAGSILLILPVSR